MARQLVLPGFAIVLSVTLISTLLLQTYSQQTLDAIQDQRIEMGARVGTSNTAKIDVLTSQMFEIKASIDRMNGIGIGFGSLLSGLLALDMFFRSRQNRH